MRDNLNGIDNLDYTIELDGTKYNITAADSLNADVARRTKEALHIALSNSKETNYEDFAYDGHYSQSISIVPSTGGKFTGNIETPNIINIEDNEDYAINLFSVKKLIANLQGFPTYILEGDTLVEVNVNDKSLSPFKVVLYSKDLNNPTNIRFKDAAENIIKSYFLAINLKTGWLSLGYCDSTSTTYTDLRVQKVDYAKTISQYDANDEPINTDVTNEDRPFDHARLLNIEDNLFDTNDKGTIIYQINNNITENTNKIENVTAQVIDNRLELEKHINDRAIHRLIAHGTNDANDANFIADYNDFISKIKVNEVKIPNTDNTGHLTVDASGQPTTTSKSLVDSIPSAIEIVPIGSIYIKLES